MNDQLLLRRLEVVEGDVDRRRGDRLELPGRGARELLPAGEELLLGRPAEEPRRQGVVLAKERPEAPEGAVDGAAQVEGARTRDAERARDLAAHRLAQHSRQLGEPQVAGDARGGIEGLVGELHDHQVGAAGEAVGDEVIVAHQRPVGAQVVDARVHAGGARRTAEDRRVGVVAVAVHRAPGGRGAQEQDHRAGGVARQADDVVDVAGQLRHGHRYGQPPVVVVAVAVVLVGVDAGVEGRQRGQHHEEAHQQVGEGEATPAAARALRGMTCRHASLVACRAAWGAAPRRRWRASRRTKLTPRRHDSSISVGRARWSVATAETRAGGSVPT